MILVAIWALCLGILFLRTGKHLGAAYWLTASVVLFVLRLLG